jgi:hypothetical protein
LRVRVVGISDGEKSRRFDVSVRLELRTPRGGGVEISPFRL